MKSAENIKKLFGYMDFPYVEIILDAEFDVIEENTAMTNGDMRPVGGNDTDVEHIKSHIASTVTTMTLSHIMTHLDSINIKAKKKMEKTDIPAFISALEDQILEKLKEMKALPAFGWVENLRYKAGKLIADFKKIPHKLFTIIKNGGFNTRSIETCFNWKGQGVNLMALALLGNDKPAVDDLADLDKLAGLYKDENGEDKTHDILNVDLCKVGTWNGKAFTEEDFKQMVANQDLFRKPIKIGHQEDQDYGQELNEKDCVYALSDEMELTPTDEYLKSGDNVIKNQEDGGNEEMEKKEVIQALKEDAEFKDAIVAHLNQEITTKQELAELREKAGKYDELNITENIQKLGDAIGSNSKDIVVLNDELKQSINQLKELTGQEDGTSLNDHVKALKEKKVQEVIAKGKTDGKITEKTEAHWVKSLNENFDDTVKHLEDSEPIVALKSHTSENKEEGKKPETLSDEKKIEKAKALMEEKPEFYKALNITPEQFIKGNPNHPAFA